MSEARQYDGRLATDLRSLVTLFSGIVISEVVDDTSSSANTSSAELKFKVEFILVTLLPLLSSNIRDRSISDTSSIGEEFVLFYWVVCVSYGIWLCSITQQRKRATNLLD